MLMKKIILAIAACMLTLTACDTEYYEPEFGYDNLPATLPASGGQYSVAFDYVRFYTKSQPDQRFFEWDYRVVICESVASENTVRPGWEVPYNFKVDIPRNKDPYPRPVIVEASIHYRYDAEDYWSDWFPVASAVQLAY